MFYATMHCIRNSLTRFWIFGTSRVHLSYENRTQELRTFTDRLLQHHKMLKGLPLAHKITDNAIIPLKERVVTSITIL